MAKGKWVFAPNELSEVEGPNNAGISTFTQNRSGSLIRELLQNSIDAQLSVDQPVETTFNLIDLSVNNLDLKGLRLSLEAAINSDDNDDRHRKQFKRGLGAVKKAIKQRTIPALVITDSNTTGAPDIDGRKDKWHSLTKSQGKSQKDTSDAGGSFGIGKHATFAATDLRTVLYSTAYKDPPESEGLERRFTGKAILVSHQRNKKSYRATGWLGTDAAGPLANADVPPNFKLDSPGTRIAILGFPSERKGMWAKDAIEDVIFHFFHALTHGNLQVRVGTEIVSAQELDKWVEEIKDERIRERVRERVEVSRQAPTATTTIDGVGTINLRVKVDEDGKQRAGTVVLVRDAGMMITDKLSSMQLSASTRMIPSIPRSWKGFTSIVECLSEGENSMLREAEAPRHDMVSPDNADEADRENVKEALRKLGEWVFEELRRVASPPEINDTDNASEMTGYLPLGTEIGSSQRPGSQNYEITEPVQAVAAPRGLVARRRGGSRLLPGNNGEAPENGTKRKRKVIKKGRVRRVEPVQQGFSDLRRLPHSLSQWPDHSVKFAFDKPESDLKTIRLYAKGEDGREEQIQIERAYLAGRRLKVKDWAVVNPSFDHVKGNRIEVEFKAIRPIRDKRVEIRATR